MTEKRFLNFVLFEGILLALIGVGMLLLPKITSITFGLMICIGFIAYGIYKVINAIVTRNYSRHFVLNIILGVILATLGILLLTVPTFNLVILTAIIGIYFLIESVSSTAFAVQNRKTLYWWWAIALVAILQFLIGLMIILGLPNTAFWVVGILAGINFLITGMIMISLYISNKYIYNI